MGLKLKLGSVQSVLLGKQRVPTQRAVKLREAAGAQFLGKSGLPVKACSALFPLWPELSTPELQSICKSTQTLWNVNSRTEGEGLNCCVQ